MKSNMLVALLIIGLIGFACENSSTTQTNKDEAKADTLQSDSSLAYKYKTDNLIVHQLSKHIYSHISFLQTTTFGRVDCNGMIVVNEGEAIIFDTPADNESSKELITYLKENLKCKIKAIIPTHFHEDCVAGLEKFKEYDIPCYASDKTITLLKNKKPHLAIPIINFKDSLALAVGSKTVYTQYFGEGHTKDNVIGYFPEDKAVFGGCLIKTLGASKGNLEDANVNVWSETVRKLQMKYPQAEIVIPGHGKWGGTDLFDYTIKLFEQK
jgi:metallo-beta-lactamase class B